MAHLTPPTKETVTSLEELGKLIKQRTPEGLGQPIQADFSTIAIGALKLLLDFSVYLFMTGILVMGVVFLFSAGNEETLTRAKRTLNQSLYGFVIVFAAFAVLQFFTGKLAVPLASVSVATIFGTAYNLVLLAASTGFLFIILYSGVRYLFAGGNEESQAGAKKMMTAAMYGIILTLGSYAISKFLISTFTGFVR